MSRFRQGRELEDRLWIRSLAVNYAAGVTTHPHAHRWHQLVFAADGALLVRAPEGAWVVPPQRAVWVPAGARHTLEAISAVSLRTLYLRPSFARRSPPRCCVVSVPPLLRELILHAVSIGMLDREKPAQRRLAQVIADQLAFAQAAPLQLPWPKDPRARRLAEALQARVGEARPLREVAQRTGASRRTLERLFHAEVGVSLGRWRQQLRMHAALRLLAAGQPVTSAALEVGYESPSAFIAAFRRLFGTTPGRYFEQPMAPPAAPGPAARAPASRS